MTLASPADGDDPVGLVADPGLLRSTLQSSAWLILSYAAGAGAVFVISIIVGRALGPESLGRYSYGMWVLRIVPAILALGVPLALSKTVAEKLGSGAGAQARRLVRIVVGGHLVVSVPLAAAAIAACLLGDWGEPGVVAVIAGGLVVALLALDVEGVLAGLRRFRALSVLATVTGIAQVIVTGIGAAAGLGWLALLALFVGVGALSLVAMAISAHAPLALFPAERLPRGELPTFARFAAIAAAAVVVEALLWGRMELFFLERFGDSQDVGLYSAALRVASVAAVLPLVAARPLMPEFARLRGAGASEELRELYVRTCSILAVVIAPVTVIGAAMSPAAIRVVYGTEFDGAATAGVILTGSSFLLGLAGVLGPALLTGPRPRIIAELGAIGVAANVVADIVLVPAFGLVGAAVANAVAQALWLSVALVAAARIGLRYPVSPLLRSLVAGAPAAAVAVAITAALGDVAGVMLGLPVALIVYVACALGVGAVTTADARALLTRPVGR